MKALIFGVNGQDGSYLARFLLGKGYTVVGTSRDVENNSWNNLRTLGILNKIEIRSLDLTHSERVFTLIESVGPDEIYNLAGQTSVGLSFDMPNETINSILIGTLNILEALRRISREIKYYNAGSSECFGDTGGYLADEETPFSPRSPYAVAKCAAHYLVSNYRESYSLKACTGILFNHESRLRSDNFVTQKIITTARDIYNKKTNKIELGNLNIYRDWGWAPDYVEAMWLMLQNIEICDVVVSTGRMESLKYFAEKVFEYFDLKLSDYLVENSRLLRPSDIEFSCGSPKKAGRVLGWKPKYDIDDVVIMLCEGKL